MNATHAGRHEAACSANAPAMRVLVLGGHGQLGSDVIRAAAGFESLSITPFTRAQLDLADIAAIHRVLHDAEFDVVLNCAGCNRTMEAEHDPREAFAINAHAVGAVAAVCRERSARLVHVSSDYVFDGTNDVPYTERDAVRPLNVYGASKALGEALAMHHQPAAVIVRTASLFGTGGSRSKGGRNFVEAVIARARQGEPFDVVADITMSPTASADLAHVLLALIERDVPGGVYHAVNTGCATWHELASVAVAAAGGDPGLLRRARSEKASGMMRPRYTVLDNSLVGSVVGAMRPWRDALADYMAARTRDDTTANEEQ